MLSVAVWHTVVSTLLEYNIYMWFCVQSITCTRFVAIWLALCMLFFHIAVKQKYTCSNRKCSTQQSSTMKRRVIEHVYICGVCFGCVCVSRWMCAAADVVDAVWCTKVTSLPHVCLLAYTTAQNVGLLLNAVASRYSTDAAMCGISYYFEYNIRNTMHAPPLLLLVLLVRVIKVHWCQKLPHVAQQCSHTC
jgi:hypothetical protein